MNGVSVGSDSSTFVVTAVADSFGTFRSSRVYDPALAELGLTETWADADAGTAMVRKSAAPAAATTCMVFMKILSAVPWHGVDFFEFWMRGCAGLSGEPRGGRATMAQRGELESTDAGSARAHPHRRDLRDGRLDREFGHPGEE